jgi:3D (Asp-Asp-Asp) domain-containing protein
LLENGKPTNALQRLARRLLLGLCAALAIGIAGEAFIQLVDRHAGISWAGQSVVSPTDEPALAPEHMESIVQEADHKNLSAASMLPMAAVDSADSPRRHIIWMEVTAYCPCTKCCGEQAAGITASGKTVGHNNGRFVAADTRLLPFGTQLSIPGYHGGQIVPVLDRGGAIKGNRLDVYFPTHQEALKWGRQRLPVTVIEE